MKQAYVLTAIRAQVESDALRRRALDAADKALAVHGDALRRLGE